MKCPECVRLGLRSKVYESGVRERTAVRVSSYYDEDGTYHADDPNTYTARLHCTQGHRWIERTQGSTGEIQPLPPLERR